MTHRFRDDAYSTEGESLISIPAVHRVGAKKSAKVAPSGGNATSQNLNRGPNSKYPDKVQKFKDMIFANPTLDDLSGQWTMTFAWVVLGLIGIGVVWDSNAVTELIVPDCGQESDIQKSAVLLLIIVAIHFVIFLVCGIRLYQNEKANFDKIYFPFVNFYGAFVETQLLFKVTILITSGLGVASSIRTYYLLSDPAMNPIFSQPSGLIFMITIVLFGFLGIYQMDRNGVIEFYKDADIDLRFWESAQHISQALNIGMFLVVFFMFIVHGATYHIPENCIEGSKQGATALWVFGMISMITVLVCFTYIFFNAAAPEEYDSWGWGMRNLLGFASHILYFCYFLYIVLYFAAGLANVGNQVIVRT